MTQELANGDVFLLPMNNKRSQQERKRHGRGSARWIVSALTAFKALFSIATSAQAAWYNSKWQYRKKPNIIPWVKIESIWDTKDIQVCMHGGNSSATSQQNDREVWSFGGSNDSRSLWQQL
jgi:hypothetical protein